MAALWLLAKVTVWGKANRMRSSDRELTPLSLQLFNWKCEIMRSCGQGHLSYQKTVSRLNLQSQNLQNPQGSHWMFSSSVSQYKSLYCLLWSKRSGSALMQSHWAYLLEKKDIKKKKKPSPCKTAHFSSFTLDDNSWLPCGKRCSHLSVILCC